jgi:hypothetical protein
MQESQSLAHVQSRLGSSLHLADVEDLEESAHFEDQEHTHHKEEALRMVHALLSSPGRAEPIATSSEFADCSTTPRQPAPTPATPARSALENILADFAEGELKMKLPKDNCFV